MNLLQIQQAILVSDVPERYRLVGQSPGFLDTWQGEAKRICVGFGERPAGVACPPALFVQPLGRQHVAVVQAADRDDGNAGQVPALAFYFLVLPRGLYRGLAGDPFLIAERFPPPWSARGELPPLAWKGDPPPRRNVADLQRVIDVPNSATLLGGVQVLVDGGRLAFERTEPAPHLVRSLWALLPDDARAELWPATFAFSNDHRFHVAVVPRIGGPAYEHCVFEEQAGDYPEGRYELALHMAIDAGDQAEMERLLSRRSRSETMRLGLILLLVLVLGMIAINLFVHRPTPRPTPRAAGQTTDKPS